MKKILIFIVFFAAVAAVFYYFSRQETKKETATSSINENENSDFQPDPSSATFIFDDGSVTLSSGRSEKPAGMGSAFVEEIVILDKFAYGDINMDNKPDTVLLLARYGAGSGSFIYLAGFISGPVNYKGSRVFYIGDRVSPQSLSINQGTVTMEYLDRAPDEPFAAEPTVHVSKQLVYKNGEFVER